MHEQACDQLGSVSKERRYQGRHVIPVLRSLGAPRGVLMDWYILRVLKEQGFHFDPEVDNKSMYKPEEQWRNLGKFGRMTEFKPDPKTWSLAWKLTLKEFGGNYNLRPLVEEEDLRRAIHGEKSSGAPLFETKDKAFEKDLARMSRFVSGACAAQPCIAYHRVQHGEKGPKTRLVWGYPLMMTLLEAKYARPLIQEFLRRRTAMAFGLDKMSLGARLTPISNSGLRYGFDFSAYDSSLHPRLIDGAFKVLKTHFAEVNAEEWNRMVHYFIHTPIIMPDGWIYRKHKGVPSGSYFTQMVDSIVNFFCVQYATYLITGTFVERKKILVLGDDGIVGFPSFIPLRRWRQVFLTLGLSLNSEKSGITRCGKPFHFLGHSWWKGLSTRPLQEVAKRMVFPERPSKIKDRRVRTRTRAYSYLGDAAGVHYLLRMLTGHRSVFPMSIYMTARLDVAELLERNDWRTRDGCRKEVVPFSLLRHAYLARLK